MFDASLLDAGEGRDVLVPPDAGAPDADTCMHSVPPPRPDVEDAPDVQEIVFALHDLVLDQREERWRTIGFDLDGLCSDPPEPIVECLPESISAPPEIDGVGGIDNALGHHLLDLLLFATPDFSADLERNARIGVSTPILRVRHWNGTPNDPEVEVAFTQSVVGTPALPDGGPPALEIPPRGYDYDDGGNAPPLPQYDGNDWWWVRHDTFLDGDPDRPRVRDDRAYVAGGVLVVTLPDRFPIHFAGSTRTFTVVLTDAWITGTLRDDGRVLENAVLGGRWPVVDLIDTLDSAGICPDQTEYGIVVRVTDFAADVRADPRSVGPGVVCDAISVGIGATGASSRIAAIVDTFGTPNACAARDAGTRDGDASTPDDAGFDAAAEDGGT